MGWDGNLHYFSSPAEDPCFSYAVNDFGQVIGSWDYSRGFIWDEGAFIDLGDFGFRGNQPQGLNNRGQVVGSVWVNAERDGHGYLWDDGALIDVNTLLPGASDLVVTTVFDINDAGQLLARAERGSEWLWIVMTPPGIRGLGPAPGTAGTTNTLEAIQATPGGTVDFYYGSEEGSSAAFGCFGLTVNVDDATWATTTADAQGNASVDVAVPAGDSGEALRFYAVDRATCTVSNVSLHHWP
jgi:probable HAF family extracellular repeat protein